MQEYPKWIPDPDDPEKGHVALGPDDDQAPHPTIIDPAHSDIVPAPVAPQKRKPGRPRKDTAS